MSVVIEKLEDKTLSEREKSQNPSAQRNLVELTQLMGETFLDLVIKFPELGVEQRDVELSFNLYKKLPKLHRGYRIAEEALMGRALNKQGARESQLYIAKDGQDMIGWLNVAADHSNNWSHRLAKSYVWLVNGGVHPEHQRNGIMKELLSRALTDKEGPKVFSLTTFVSAYPFVLPPDVEGKLPAVEALHKIGIEPTDPPFEDRSFFGTEVLMQRHQGGSPNEILWKL
jgi:GNAT superfamily N-acetyltransferase